MVKIPSIHGYSFLNYTVLQTYCTARFMTEHILIIAIGIKKLIGILKINPLQ